VRRVSRVAPRERGPRRRQARRERLLTVPALLAGRGLRLTTARKAVLQALLDAGEPVSVAELHARLARPRVNLVSVYRAVHLLSAVGVVRLADTANGTRRFELAEAFSGHHHHLICRGCGRVEDVAGCLIEAEALRALDRRVQRSRRFRIVDHDVRLFGLCGGCDGRG
jgi:Fur family transcriptional regulator, ferric uptake regulator